MTLPKHLERMNYLLESSYDDWVYIKDFTDYAVYVKIGLDGDITVCKMPKDLEVKTTVVKWSESCAELYALLEKWDNVTPADFN